MRLRDLGYLVSESTIYLWEHHGKLKAPKRSWTSRKLLYTEEHVQAIIALMNRTIDTEKFTLGE